MRKFNLFLIYVFHSLITIINTKEFHTPKEAICIVPVADILNIPFEFINPNLNICKQYESIPISGEKGFLNCERTHQILFNEKVQIIEEYEEEVQIKISTTFNQAPDSEILNCTYFTLKKNLLPISELNLSIEDTNLIPKAIDFNSTTFEIPENNTVTLILPFFDEITKQTYSGGTRFVFTEKDDDNYTIAIYDPINKKFVKTKINKHNVIEPTKQTNQEKVQNFINLLNLWTEFGSKNIPYVWGGISLQKTTSPQNFCAQTGFNYFGRKIRYYKNNDIEETPFSGFDCSSLIVRAAQISQIPYFFKNTATLQRNLKMLESSDKIENGDLIWFPGHVIIITDVSNNLCTEARGYASGYGVVHKIELNKLFKGIETFEDLKNAFFNNRSLELLNKFNKVSLEIIKFKILKLDSVWHWKKNNKQNQM